MRRAPMRRAPVRRDPVRDAPLPPRGRLAAMLTDPHLWLPLVVLALGLATLAWVHA